MNERIRELAVQAGLGHERWNTTEQFESFIERFSESIVGECISTLENGYRDYRNQIEDGMRDHCIALLKHKFGVEE